MHRLNNELDTAAKLLKELIEFMESSEESNEIDLISVKARLASTYRELNKDKEAENLINSVIDQAYEVTNGEGNLFTANLENARGMIYKKQKRFQEAERDYLRVLAVRGEFLEEEHPEILGIKHNLSILIFVRSPASNK